MKSLHLIAGFPLRAAYVLLMHTSNGLSNGPSNGHDVTKLRPVDVPWMQFLLAESELRTPWHG